MNDMGKFPKQPCPVTGDENFHFLAYPAHVLVFLLDADNRCEFVSPSLTTFTGRDAAREMGDGWLEHLHPDDRMVFMQGLEQARHSLQPTRQLFRYRRQDGVYRWFVNQGMARTAPAGGFAGQVGLCFDVTAYQDGEAEAEQSAQHMIALLKQTRLIAVVLDTQGRVQFSNGGLCRLLNAGGVELMDCHLFEQHLADRNRDLLATLYPGGTQNPHFPTEFESELRTRSNESRYVSWHTIVLRDMSGRIKSTILIGDDVTELRLTEAQLSLSAKIFEATDHAMLVTDLDGTIVAINNAFTLLTGYSEAEALGQNPSLLQSGRHDEAFYGQLWEKLLATGHWHGDIWDRRKDGSIYPKYLSISVIKDDAGKPTNYAGLFYDISERKTVEERLDHLAHYDTLTGIPNRCLLLDRLEQEAERATRQQTKLGLLYLDLDHFKLVNDTLGHSAGDELLKEIAQRLKACVRAVDTVARLGGDEFVVLIPDIKENDDLARVSTKILNALMAPCKIEGRSLVTSPSIGISIYPDDCSDIHDLLKHADTAMYRVKQNGRGFYKFFGSLDH